MGRRRRRNYGQEYMYHISVLDWSVSVEFNEYAYTNLLNKAEFEESIYMLLEGRLIYTMSKKCRKNLAAQVAIHSHEHWNRNRDSNNVLSVIGSMEIMRADPYVFTEDTFTSWVAVPPKSYENIRNYLTYKGKAKVVLMGTDLKYRRGEISYFCFEKLSP